MQLKIIHERKQVDVCFIIFERKCSLGSLCASIISRQKSHFEKSDCKTRFTSELTPAESHKVKIQMPNAWPGSLEIAGDF